MAKSLKILILEDSATDAELLKRFLLKEKMKCAVSVAMNRKDFLEALENFRPDIILSDHSLPQFDSADALAVTRQRFPHLPFILVTGTVSEEYAANIIKLGADDYILKDRIARLPAAIEAALNKRGIEKEIADYKYALDQAAIVAITDQKGLITYANEEFCKISKYTVDELLGQDHRIINSGHHPASFIKNLWVTIANGRSWRGEFCNKAKDGTLYWVDTTIIPFLNDKGKPYQYLSIRIDITAEKAVEAQLIEREKQLQLFIEHSPASLAMFNADMRYLAVSHRWLTDFNLEGQVLIGKSHYEVFPGIPQRWKDVHQRCLQGAIEKSEEDQFVNPDGSINWKKWEIRPWYRASGEVGGIIIFNEDITERKKAAQKIIQSEENLKAIFDNSSEGFVLLDNKCVIKAFNHRASQVFLINSTEEMKTGKSIFDFVEPERLVFFKGVMAVVLKGESIQYDRSYRAEKGGASWINFILNPVWKDGVIKGVCITAMDITSRKEAEELVQKSFSEKKALAERVSAILNTLPAHIALLDEKGLIVDVNDSWKNFADDNGFIGSNYGIADNYIKVSKKFPGDGTTVAKGIEAVLNHQQREFIFEYSCHSPTIKRWFRMVVTPLLEKEYAGAVVMHIDISQLRRLEEERLHNRVEEQKKISRAILATQEKERHAIGLELHDNVNQILVGTMMTLSLVKNNNEKDQQLIETSLSHLRSAIHENRKIAHVFVAPDLETEKLISQLERLFTNMLSTLDIEVLFDSSQFSEELLDRDRKTNIYRIAQEQCTNIIKYAHATTVTIIISSTDQLFRMSIADNGKGMKAGKKATGIGLKNINARLGLFNGKATIITAEGKGFTLEISIPL